MRKFAIFGVPRSGTSWLSQIINSHSDVVLRFQPLFSYAHKGKLHTDSSKEDIDCFYEEILNSQDKFALMDTESHKKYPKFFKSDNATHLGFKETRYLHVIENLLQKSDIKIIGIIRNPLATLDSWIRAPKEFDKSWSVEEEWRYAKKKNLGREEEFYGFNKWKEVAENFMIFEKDFPESFKLVDYSELNADPFEVTKKLFNFCGLDFSKQVEDFILQSSSIHDEDPYSVFRQKLDDNLWKSRLPANIIQEVLAETRSTKLNRFLRDI